MKSMTPFNFILMLWSREIHTSVTAEGKLYLEPVDTLTDDDRAYIRANRDALLALVRNGEQLDHLPVGWQQAEHMPERCILVAKGRLIDSCIFRSEAGAKAFMSLITTFTPRQAFRAACAIEDGEHDPIKLEAIARASTVGGAS